MIKQHELNEFRMQASLMVKNVKGRNGFDALENGGNGDCDTARKVGRSIAYMREHVNQPLQISTLAAQANVSPSHFFALFKQMTGHPPMDYFTKLRMCHACLLLDSTTARVKEVAAALGYDDPLYFSRVFKSVSAVAPLHYRGLGFASRREIKEQLKPKSTVGNGDSLRRGGLGHLATQGNSRQA